MAKLRILSQNPDELKLFSKVLTPKQTTNGFKISLNTGKVSTRKKRANRANTPGHILKELNQAIKFEDLQGWKDFSNSIGVRWSVASLFIAGALKKNKMADIGELRNGLLRLGGSTGVAQAPAPVATPAPAPVPAHAPAAPVAAPIQQPIPQSTVYPAEDYRAAAR